MIESEFQKSASECDLEGEWVSPWIQISQSCLVLFTTKNLPVLQSAIPIDQTRVEETWLSEIHPINDKTNSQERKDDQIPPNKHLLA